MVTPMVIFHQAIENAKPSITTRRVKKGGKSFHVRRCFFLETFLRVAKRDFWLQGEGGWRTDRKTRHVVV